MRNGKGMCDSFVDVLRLLPDVVAYVCPYQVRSSLGV